MKVQKFLERRFEALEAGDFRSVYQSYHKDSPFRRQFPECDDYLAFAAEHLAAISVRRWECKAQRALGADRVECLLLMELSAGGDSMVLYESALLIDCGGQWRYHSAEKLGPDDYAGNPDEISFADFDRVEEKIRY